jgi:hypothetical protein
LDDWLASSLFRAHNPIRKIRLNLVRDRTYEAVSRKIEGDQSASR